jgi:hypothetical protein
MTTDDLHCIHDVQTQDAMDATFRSWAPPTIGYGSHAIILGPQVIAFDDH